MYSSNVEDQHSFIESAKEKGYDVLLADGPLGSHLVGKLEQHFENSSFVRVDADIIDNLIKKEEKQSSKLTEEEQNTLKPIVESQVAKEKFTVVFESLSEKDSPMLITQPEFIRRMKDMQQMGGGMFGAFPEMYNLVVNTNHPLISKILVEKDDDKKSKLAKQAADLALLSQNMLKGEALTQFVKRSVELI